MLLSTSSHVFPLRAHAKGTLELRTEMPVFELQALHQKAFRSPHVMSIK